LVKHILKNNNIDKEKSFYCGDAAGRVDDHSNDDILFSTNIGLKFYSPEMLFQGSNLDF
jgi:bifunctional polynucleotide phosphatase/kinase